MASVPRTVVHTRPTLWLQCSTRDNIFPCDDRTKMFLGSALCSNSFRRAASGTSRSTRWWNTTKGASADEHTKPHAGGTPIFMPCSKDESSRGTARERGLRQQATFPAQAAHVPRTARTLICRVCKIMPPSEVPQSEKFPARCPARLTSSCSPEVSRRSHVRGVSNFCRQGEGVSNVDRRCGGQDPPSAVVSFFCA